MKKLLLATLATVLALSATCFGSGKEYGDEDRDEGSGAIYGMVREMPRDVYGIWSVSDRKVRVAPSTRIEEKNGPLQLGCMVEVKGVVKEGILEANEVEVKR